MEHSCQFLARVRAAAGPALAAVDMMHDAAILQVLTIEMKWLSIE